jgi:hypothetical protein
MLPELGIELLLHDLKELPSELFLRLIPSQTWLVIFHSATIFRVLEEGCVLSELIFVPKHIDDLEVTLFPELVGDLVVAYLPQGQLVFILQIKMALVELVKVLISQSLTKYEFKSTEISGFAKYKILHE